MLKIWKYSAIAISSIMIAAIAAFAQDPYGKVGELWSNGASFEQLGNFEAALEEYQEALNQNSSIPDPMLRDCARQGTIARIEGATAGQQYVHNHGTSPDALRAAQALADNRFREAMDEFDQTRPDLANSCP